MSERVYLLLNDEDVPFGRGVLITASDAPEIRVKLMDGGIDDIRTHKLITLVGTSQTMPTLRGSVVRTSDNMLVLRRVESKEDVREMLRVNVAFDSLMYPVSGEWTGRRKIEFADLSCGGIAFFCDEIEKPMERGEIVEVVIPVTTQPLLLRCKILRSWEKSGRNCYAAKFIDMCHDEEKLVCEAVFSIQLDQHRKRS